MSGATLKFVTLHSPSFTFDPGELRAAFSAATRAIIVNTPNNPSGKVFTREELSQIAELCREFDALCITDEIYEHILYDKREHVPMATLPGMYDRTVTISGLSKTFSITGWRLGYVLARPELSDAIRKVHDFLTVGAPAPLQEGAAIAMEQADAFYGELSDMYDRKRGILLRALREAGFRCHEPEGAYYIMGDFTDLPFEGDDVTFARHMIEKVGVAPVPGSSFYRPGNAEGSRLVRFTFSKSEETLEEAARRLARI
jgi:aminotransferase